MRLTFEAQLLPTCLAMAYLIEWSQSAPTRVCRLSHRGPGQALIPSVITPASLLGATFQALQCKTYTFGLLVTLLSRESLKSDADHRNGTKVSSWPGWTISIPCSVNQGAQVYGMTSRGPVEIGIHVDTETYVNVRPSLHHCL